MPNVELTSDRATAATAARVWRAVLARSTTPLDVSALEASYDWLMLIWDRKGRVVCREPGSDVHTLITFAEQMIEEGSAHDWELIDMPLARMATERL